MQQRGHEVSYSSHVGYKAPPIHLRRISGVELFQVALDDTLYDAPSRGFEEWGPPRHKHVQRCREFFSDSLILNMQWTPTNDPFLDPIKIDDGR